MKNLLYLGLFISFIFACSSTPVQTSNRVGSTSLQMSSRGIDPLDIAIREISDYLNEKLAPKTYLAVLNIQSDSPALSNLIIEMLTDNTVNDNVFTQVTRQHLDIIKTEINFNQTSGEVSRESMQRAGNITGVQIVIIGDLTKFGDLYQLRIQALEVSTALIKGHIIRSISNSPKIASFTGTPGRSMGAARSDPLDVAIHNASDYLSDNLAPEKKLAILNIQSDYSTLTDHIIKLLTDFTVNSGQFNVVSRNELDIIRSERDFQQNTGEVSLATRQAVGQMTGAQTVIVGRVYDIGGTYQLRIQALGVSDGLIEGSREWPILNSPTINLLVESEKSHESDVSRRIERIWSSAVKTANSAWSKERNKAWWNTNGSMLKYVGMLALSAGCLGIIYYLNPPSKSL